MHIQRSAVIRGILSTVLLALVTAASSQAETGWSLRLQGVWVDPDVAFRNIDDDGDTIRAEVESDIGAGLAVEYQFSDRLGVEFGALYAAPELDIRIGAPGSLFGSLRATDDISFAPITLGLNVHLTPRSKVDLYVGPLAAYVLYGDLSIQFEFPNLPNLPSLPGIPTIPVFPIDPITIDLETDDDFAFGAQVGIDVPFGDGRWAFHANVKYLETSIELIDDIGDSTDLDFDPLIIGVGARIRL